MIIVAVGEDPTPVHCIQSSPDGITWTLRSSALDGGDGSAVAWNGSLFMASGYNGSSVPGIVTSPDGVTWTTRSIPSAWSSGNGPTGIAWNGSLWMVVRVNSGTSGSHAVMTSPDATTWTERTTPYDGTSAARAQAVGWFGTAGLWVVTAAPQSSGLSVVATSPDAATWTQRTTPFGTGANANAFAVATDGHQCLIGGTNNSSSTTVSLIRSLDGVTWTTVTIPVSATVTSLCWNGSMWAAGLIRSAAHVIMTSPDGITWTARTTPWDAAKSVWGLTWDSTQFVAGGDNFGDATTIMTSPNGVTWTERSTPFDSFGLVNRLAANYIPALLPPPTTAADTLAALTDSASPAGPLTVIPRPALLGPGPSQVATPVGAGGVGGGTELVMRITAWDCEVADEGSSKLTFTLAIPPPGKAPTPPSLYFPQLIADLQNQVANTATAVPTIPTTGGGGTGTLTAITSLDGTVIITNPGGPTVDLSKPDPDPSGGALIGETLDGTPTTNPFNTTLGYGAMAVHTPGATDTASGGRNTAVGANAMGVFTGSATGNNNTAVGVSSLGNTQTGFQNTAIGIDAKTSTDSNMTVTAGLSADARADKAIAIGVNALAGAVGAIAIGYQPSAWVGPAGSESGVAVGNSIAIGTSALAASNNDIAVGYNANCPSSLGESVAIGYQATTGGFWNIAIGKQARTGADAAIAVGVNALAGAVGAIAIGQGSAVNLSTSQAAVAIGVNATANGNCATAVGLNSLAPGDFSAAIGMGANAPGGNSVAIGPGAIARGDHTVAVGYNADAELNYSVSIGQTYSQVAIGPCTATQFPSNHGAGLFLPDGASAPGTPVGGIGGVLFSASGALKYRGGSGTITTLAPA